MLCDKQKGFTGKNLFCLDETCVLGNWNSGICFSPQCSLCEYFDKLSSNSSE